MISGGGQPATLHPMRLDGIGDDFFTRLTAFQMFPNRMNHYWTSSANPRHDMCHFAVSASNCNALLVERQGEWSLLQKKNRDTVDLDWLSPTVVIRACTLGVVKLWDVRNHAENDGPRLRHPSFINHVRRIDENIILVAGTQDTVRKGPYI